jgi:hypothetical protein
MMLFGLTNAPGFFQDMISYILKDFFDKGVDVCIDNIPIYVKHEEMYDELVKEVLEKLTKNDLVKYTEKYV